MSRLIIIILLLGGGTFWWHWNANRDPVQRKKLLQKTIIGTLIVVLLLLVVTGRMHWIGAIIAGFLASLRQAIPFLVRYFPTITQLYRNFAGKSGRTQQSSTVTSAIIEMTLEHDSGKLSGRVLQGPFQGQSLDELDRGKLDELYSYCASTDHDSARLLASYLSARFGNEQGFNEDKKRDTGVAQTSMSLAEALQVLGLEGEPSEEDITRAYRKIMQQLHPDRGGNEYFAAKANEARKVLMTKYG